MGNVKKLPVKESEISQIAAALKQGEQNMKVVVLVRLDKRGDIELDVFNPERDADALLVVKQAVSDAVDSIWREERQG